MKVLVIGGGISPERAVSLRSANAVLTALKQAGHAAELYDWDGSVGWLQQNAHRFEVVFPALHGEGGEDGQIQTIVESLNCKYVGSDSASSAKCISKRITRDTLQANGILVPEGAMVDESQYREHPLAKLPHVLKPDLGGSSIDTFIIPDVSVRDLAEISRTFKTYKQLLLEEYIGGDEMTVPILDGIDLPVIEIVPPKGGFFDYENKYNGATQEICPPKHISTEVQHQAIELSKKVHDIMGCRHLSRTDLILRDDKLYVMEVNTMPGFTDASLFPRAAKVAGLDMPKLTDLLVNLAGGNHG